MLTTVDNITLTPEQYAKWLGIHPGYLTSEIITERMWRCRNNRSKMSEKEILLDTMQYIRGKKKQTHK